MKLRNRIMSAVMAIVASMTFISATAFAAEGAVTLTPSTVEVKAGETFTIDVDVTKNSGYCALGFKVTGLTEAFKLTNVEDTGLYTGKTHGNKLDVTNYSLAWWYSDSFEAEDTSVGVAAKLTYTVNADAAVGAYTITLKNDANTSMNMDGDVVPFADATVTVNVVADAPAKTEATLATEELNNKADADYYTQGFKATVTPNDDVVTAVKAVLANGTKSADVEWTGSYEGATPITFAINVINVPATETVTAEWSIVK